jgi:hypothetical protein
MLFTMNVFAQEVNSDASKKTETSATTPVGEQKAIAVKKNEIGNSQPAKKMVQDATISLQTTITGNQEQPKVLYILPWQSPTTTNVDFESLDNEQKAVFGHVEREELRRELESSDVIQ